MNTNGHIRFFLCCVSCFIFFIATISSAQTVNQAPVFDVIKVTDPQSALINDSQVLGLDLSGAEFEYHKSWAIYSDNQFQLRQHNSSGHFAYVHKETQWSVVEKSKEPQSIDSLKENALNLLYALGIPEDQIKKATIRRMIAQSEDDQGNAIGPKETVGYIIFVSRQIQGIPVWASFAKVVFNVTGQLHKVNLQWRKINPTAIDYKQMIDEEFLEVTAYQNVRDLGIGKDPDMFYGGFGYVERPYDEEQNTLSLQYIYSFSYGNGVQREAISAIEEY